MILYHLGCDADHVFESWFRDSAAFDDQQRQGLLACPVCRSTHVTKTIMAPAVVGGRDRLESRERPLPLAPPPRLPMPPSMPPVSMPALPMPPMPPRGVDVALLDDKRLEIRAALKGIRDKILSEGQDVGARFPDQARRMHDGDIPMKQIHGQATPDEARDLIEDGILILPIPILPEELN